MARLRSRIVEKTKYKYVSLVKFIDYGKYESEKYRASNPITRGVSYHKTMREAALWVDNKLIEAKKEPVNILKRL